MGTRKEKVAQRRAERSKAKGESLLPKANEELLENTLTDTADLVDKPQTISEMLAPMRESIKQDKTDAVKMQKYYALTDALSALGKMGGAAIGGTIAGNMDGAPVVPEYQPSRGYLNAFEKAKQANDRLRALDEKEFQLGYQQKVRQDEQDWQKALADETAKQKREFDRESREFDANLRREVLKRTQAHDKALAEQKAREALALQNARNAGDIAVKEIGAKTADQQYERYSKTPIVFNDGTSEIIPDNYYKALERALIDDDTITAKNVSIFIKNNPETVKKILGQMGLDVKGAKQTHVPTATTPTTSTPKYTTDFYSGLWSKPQPGNYVETAPESTAPKGTSKPTKKTTTEIPDISMFEEK